MSAKDGGSAFPKYFGGNRDLAPGEEAGMSLRDYFAAQAAMGAFGENGNTEIDDIVMARRCYELADALLRERAK